MARLLMALLLLTAFGRQGFVQQKPTPDDMGVGLGPGVVLEKVSAHGEAEKAGLQEGDVLLTWSRGASQGEIQSPFDILEIHTDQSPLGDVKLEGMRGTEKRYWSLGPDSWRLTTRPNFTGDLLATYRQGQVLAETGKSADITKAARLWQAVANGDSDAQNTRLRTWLFFRSAELLREAEQWQDADGAYQSATQSAARVGASVEVQVLQSWAQSYRQRNDWANAERILQQAIDKSESWAHGGFATASSFLALGTIASQRGNLDGAERYFGQACEIDKKLAPESLPAATCLSGLGMVAYQRGKLAVAEDFHRQSFAIREKLAPASLDVANSLMNLGDVAIQRGALAKAEEYYRQSLEIQEKLSPASLEVAASLDGIGNALLELGDFDNAELYCNQAVEIKKKLAPGSMNLATTILRLAKIARLRGNLAKAEGYYRGALDIQQKIAPGTLNLAFSLTGLGILAWERGELAGAERYYLQALSIRQKLAPGSLLVAASLNNLANVDEKRGDLDQAEEHYRQSLEIKQKLAPGSITLASNLDNLGGIEEERGNLDRAAEYYRQALEIEQKIAPGTFHITIPYNGLGNIAHRQGDLVKAEEYYSASLAIVEKLGPGSLDVAILVGNLGDLYRKKGDLGRAEQLHRQALVIREKLAPGSRELAESLAAVGSILREEQQLDEATQLYARAVNVLENQTALLGGSEEVRSSFRASHSDIYTDYVDLLLIQKQPEQAFGVLERSRARTLMEMLAAARVDIRKGADPVLLEQERSLQESLTAKSERRLQLLGEKNTEKQVAALEKEIAGLDKQYQGIEEQLHLNSPAYIALTQPQPLSTTEIQHLLDADTVLLEYLVAENGSHVFVVTSAGVNVYDLPKQADIESAAKVVYGAWSTRNTSPQDEAGPQKQSAGARAEAEYAESAEKLSQMVLAPVAQHIQGKRLLIVTNGALQYIPFAALPSPESSGGPRVPLIVGHEIVGLPSASILAILRREASTRKAAPKAVMVLADPVFNSHDDRLRISSKNTSLVASSSPAIHASALDRSGSEVNAVRGGFFPRLPFTRWEAETIYLTASGNATKALDFDASKRMVMSQQMHDYRILHLATHGLVNADHPALSGLVFSLVDGKGRDQDGFLRLNDIYNLELNADLVVLSACQTALGKQVNGEGLIGMTRGFMYAGSARVISSLWKVNDKATSELMKKFYEGLLRNGQTPAEALRAAQMWMLRQPRWKAPYHWAGFILQGEWR
jgi:CHAT domain-containing protein/Tfp pilus assembly protein PilF